MDRDLKLGTEERFPVVACLRPIGSLEQLESLERTLSTRLEHQIWKTSRWSLIVFCKRRFDNLCHHRTPISSQNGTTSCTEHSFAVISNPLYRAQNHVQSRLPDTYTSTPPNPHFQLKLDRKAQQDAEHRLPEACIRSEYGI